jgi:hypothetical protein
MKPQKQRPQSMQRNRTSQRIRGEETSILNSLSAQFRPYLLWVKIALLLLMCALKTYMVFHHEPWRDETSFLLYLKTNSFIDFFSDHRGVQFPMYELFTNSIYSVFGHTILNSQIIALVLACGITYGVLFLIKLPLRFSLPLLLTKFVFYDYSIFSNRPYSWTILLIVLFIHFTVYEKPPIMRMIVLSLMIPNHALLFVVGGSFLAYFIFSQPIEFYTSLWRHKKNLAGVLLLCLSVSVAIWSLIPPPNAYNPPFRFPPASEIVTMVIILLNQAFFSIAKTWWGTYQYLFSTETGLYISGICMIGGIAYVLCAIKTERKIWQPLLAAIISSVILFGGLSSVFIFKDTAYAWSHTSGARHAGLVYIGLLSFMFLGYQSLRATIQFRFRAAKIIAVVIGYAAWIISSYCLILSAWNQSVDDIRRDFSKTAETAAFLKSKNMDKRYIAVIPDYMTTPIALLLPEAKFYRTMSERTNKINDWRATANAFIEKYVHKLNNQDRLNLIPKEFVQRQRPLVIIGQDGGPTIIVGEMIYQKIASFSDGIVIDEDCFVYDVALQQPEMQPQMQPQPQPQAQR